MDDGQDSESVAERAVNDVPQMEDLLGARKKQNTLGQGSFFTGDVDCQLQLYVTRAAQTAN